MQYWIQNHNQGYCKHIERHSCQNYSGKSRRICAGKTDSRQFHSCAGGDPLLSIQRKEKGMVIKLDLANAFDRVKHSFLVRVLRKFGFGENFINWISACISEPWIAPLVNGIAVGFFKASRGLRQGCPLSLLLFVLQASILSFYLNKEMAEQEILGLSIARGVRNINHALFVDDTLCLGTTSLHSTYTFKDVLNKFCDASGSMLNKGKCHVYSWNISSTLLTTISRCLGFAGSASWSSFKYLGLLFFFKSAFCRD